MAKKLKVWLNNKLNKRLPCTVVIKFYRIFVTKLVLTFFVFKYPNYFKFPKRGKRIPHSKNSGNSWGEEGSSKTPWNGKSWGWGGANQRVFRGGGGVWIFSGTTQFTYRIRANALRFPLCPIMALDMYKDILNNIKIY